jgi:NTE family protein
MLAPHAKTLKIAEIATRLKRMDAGEQERLINWGYAVSDAGIRKYWDLTVPPPAAFPYPQVGIG